MVLWFLSKITQEGAGVIAWKQNIGKMYVGIITIKTCQQNAKTQEKPSCREKDPTINLLIYI